VPVSVDGWYRYRAITKCIPQPVRKRHFRAIDAIDVNAFLSPELPRVFSDGLLKQAFYFQRVMWW